MCRTATSIPRPSDAKSERENNEGEGGTGAKASNRILNGNKLYPTPPLKRDGLGPLSE